MEITSDSKRFKDDMEEDLWVGSSFPSSDIIIEDQSSEASNVLITDLLRSPLDEEDIEVKSLLPSILKIHFDFSTTHLKDKSMHAVGKMIAKLKNKVPDRIVFVTLPHDITDEGFEVVGAYLIDYLPLLGISLKGCTRITNASVDILLKVIQSTKMIYLTIDQTKINGLNVLHLFTACACPYAQRNISVRRY